MITIVTSIYIILLVIFLGTSALILRHAFKYSYLSHRFKVVVMAFSVLALGLIIFSAYLVFSLYKGPSSASPFDLPSTTSSDINF